MSVADVHGHYMLLLWYHPFCTSSKKIPFDVYPYNEFRLSNERQQVPKKENNNDKGKRIQSKTKTIVRGHERVLGVDIRR